MSGDYFEDDATRPVRASPPVFTGGDEEALTKTQEPSPASRKGSGQPKGPPLFDPIDNDVTIMVDRAASDSLPKTPRRAATRHDDSTSNRDALAQRTEATLGPRRSLSTSSKQDTWTPPARPSAPGVNALQVRKERSALWVVLAAIVIAVVIFFVLFWLLGG